MSDSGKAVFLSYASQDADAAKKLCEALRAAGVEVWFDTDGGLEHGDEWDAKIRRQIKECVLFLPIISTNTQAREEGYFRLEWDLAAERTRTIASGVAFILPVVIDATREPEALVPDRFRSVQWTRLPGGAVPPDVLARFLKLWSHRTGVLKHEGTGSRESVAGLAEAGRPGSTTPATATKSFRWLVPAVVALLALTAIAVWQPWKSSNSDLPARPELTERTTVPPSEARELVARARGLTDKLNVLPGDLNTAAGLLEQAAKHDPNDALVWSTWAQNDLRYVSLDYDSSPARHNAARAHVAQANALDPASRETRYTQAKVMRSLSYDPATLAAAEQILRPMLTEAPEDGRVLTQLGWAAWGQGRRDEALALFDRAARLPAFAAEATYSKGLTLLFSSRFSEGSRAYDELLALEPTHAQGLTGKAWLSAAWDGDLDAALDFINRIPPQMRVEDMAAFFAYMVYMFRREYDQAVQAIRAVPRDYLSAQPGPGPSGFYNGEALAAAGKSAAAEIEWRSALKTVERRLTEAPGNRSLMYFKALLLARLGDRMAAERVWKAAIELHGDSAWGALAPEVHVEFLSSDEAIAWLNGRLTDPQFWFTAAALRFGPVYDPLRANPKFTALVEKMEADPRFSPKAKPRSTPSPISPFPSLSDQPKVDQKSVAVLAFANLSDDKANEYFSDGISEELLNVLAKVPGLKVSARTSAFYFKGKDTPIPEIARKLGVAYVVEGSVRKSGDKVRITAQLIKAADGFHVWSDTFTRDIKDVFAVQDEIAGLIAQQLELKLADVPARARTVNPEAHQLYLQGRYFANQPSTANLAKAVDFLQRAVDLDSSFAVAWGALARNVALHAEYLETTPETLRESFARARRAADRAIALAPKLPDGYFARLEIQTAYDYDWNGARESLDQALALAPTDALLISNASQLATQFGDMRRALELGRRAAELDPVNAEIRYWLGRTYLCAGLLAEGETELRRAAELSPFLLSVHRQLAVALVLQDRAAEGVVEARLEKDEWSRQAALAIACWAAKDVRAADAALARLIEVASESAAYQVGEAYACRGDADAAFQWLDRAYRNRDSGFGQLRADPLLQSLRPDPRWPALLRQAGLADEQLK